MPAGYNTAEWYFTKVESVILNDSNGGNGDWTFSAITRKLGDKKNVILFRIEKKVSGNSGGTITGRKVKEVTLPSDIVYEKVQQDASAAH